MIFDFYREKIPGLTRSRLPFRLEACSRHLYNLEHVLQTIVLSLVAFGLDGGQSRHSISAASPPAFGHAAAELEREFARPKSHTNHGGQQTQASSS